ncbi:hypothetical protein BN2475_250001 [Paraburkholderia ribeironis]|uniref:Uncharacterized protein n=1 Tax=Paraburkholderia ribeironis TaxID=1247936 RepID=A0A1N7RYH3_9BURK|nr:hypothetical protein BN2475_250001 [Paraburkholderia ribeironis]
MIYIKKPVLVNGLFEILGSSTWARTRDLRINSPALYRLSYRGTEQQNSRERNSRSSWGACQYPAFIIPISLESCRASGRLRHSAREQLELFLHVLEFFGFRQRRLGLGDARPALGQIGIQLDKVLLVARHVFFGIDGIHRALGYAHRAVDAFVGVDREEVGTFAKAVHRAHIDAVGIAALDAAFGHNVSHSGSSCMRNQGRRKRQKRYCNVTSRGACGIGQRLLYVFVISLLRP